MLVSFLWLSVVNRPSYFLSFISGFFFLDSNKIKEKKAINRPAANNNKIKAVEEVCSRWREIEKQEYYRHLLPWFYFSYFSSLWRCISSLRLGGGERRLMHLVPAPAVKLMKSRVLSRPGVKKVETNLEEEQDFVFNKPFITSGKNKTKRKEATVRYEHKTLRTLMKRSSLWYLPGERSRGCSTMS